MEAFAPRRVLSNVNGRKGTKEKSSTFARAASASHDLVDPIKAATVSLRASSEPAPSCLPQQPRQQTQNGQQCGLRRSSSVGLCAPLEKRLKMSVAPAIPAGAAGPPSSQASSIGETTSISKRPFARNYSNSVRRTPALRAAVSKSSRPSLTPLLSLPTPAREPPTAMTGVEPVACTGRGHGSVPLDRLVESGGLNGGVGTIAFHPQPAAAGVDASVPSIGATVVGTSSEGLEAAKGATGPIVVPDAELGSSSFHPLPPPADTASSPIWPCADSEVRDDPEATHPPPTEATVVDVVPEETWRDPSVIGNAPKQQLDIRSFLPSRPAAPKCPRCPALPYVPPPPRARFWRHFMRHHQTDRQRAATKLAVAYLMSRRMYTLPSTLASGTLPGSMSPDPATCMEFDSAGELLAVGTSGGEVRVFNFDDYLLSQPRVRGKENHKRCDAFPPALVVETRKAVSAVVWNPDDANELACAFKHWNEVYVYDLNTERLARVYKVGHTVKGSSGGNPVLCYCPLRERKGHTLVAGGTYGGLRCWNIHVPEQAMWEMQMRSKASVTALAPVAELLAVGTADGGVCIYDVINLKVPILGATPKPVLLHTLELSSPIRHLRPASPSSPHVLALTAASTVTSFDAVRGRVKRKVLLSSGGAEGYGGLSRFMGSHVAVLQGARPAAAAQLDPGIVVANSSCPEPMIVTFDAHALCAMELLHGDTRWSLSRHVRFGEVDVEMGQHDSLYDVTLPGEVLGFDVEDGATQEEEGQDLNARRSRTRLCCSSRELHRWLAPAEADPVFKASRTGRIKIDGVRYKVQDVEVGPEHTVVVVSTAFHRDIRPEERGMVIQAALRPVEPISYKGRGSGWSQNLRVEAATGVTALTVHPLTSHVVVATAIGAQHVLGCETFC